MAITTSRESAVKNAQTGTGKYEELLKNCKELEPIPTAVAHPWAQRFQSFLPVARTAFGHGSQAARLPCLQLTRGANPQ